MNNLDLQLKEAENQLGVEPRKRRRDRLAFTFLLYPGKNQIWRLPLRVPLIASMMSSFGDDLALSLAVALGVFAGLVDHPL